MNDWIAAVQKELGVDVSFDTDAILDVAREAAHATERKAAPAGVEGRRQRRSKYGAKRPKPGQVAATTKKKK